MNVMQAPRRDEGTGYELTPAAIKSDLVRVDRSTPMGELLRRYWHPVGLASHATNTPRQVRALGEDLILFRDGAGHAGLVHARCCHRGTTLYYGKVEDRGIRCCYHGWLFDTQGHVLEQPCEPEGGLFRDKVRQPWYPVEERYGLIFAYMGPPERKPVLPRYECLEVMDEGEFVEADDSSLGGGGPQIIPCNWLQHYENVVDPFHVPVLPRYECLEKLEPGEMVEADDSSIGTGGGTIVPCNWLQHYENVLDAFHVPILHGAFSGVQFVAQMGIMPKVKWEYSPIGVKTISARVLDDGLVHYRVTEAALPTLRVVPNPRVERYVGVESLGWTLPIDDTHFRIYVAGRARQPGDLGRMRSKFNGKFWWELSEEEHRATPGDFEAQVGQGAITAHSEEHFAQSDRGIVMIRRMLQDQLDALAAGRDPIGVSFDPNAAPVAFEAGNYIRET